MISDREGRLGFSPEFEPCLPLAPGAPAVVPLFGLGSSNAHTDEISFQYPEDVTAAWRQYRAQEQQQVAATTLASGQNLAALDFNYSLSGDNPAWRPLRVYSDGIKTYIQFPRSMLSGDAPALVALGNDGSWFSSPTKQIVNYRVDGDTDVVDRVLSRAALISGVGSSQSEVQISHTGGRQLMQRHFGAVLGLALVLAGCATVSPTTSFVQSWAALTMPRLKLGPTSAATPAGSFKPTRVLFVGRSSNEWKS